MVKRLRRKKCRKRTRALNIQCSRLHTSLTRYLSCGMIAFVGNKMQLFSVECTPNIPSCVEEILHIVSSVVRWIFLNGLLGNLSFANLLKKKKGHAALH